MDCHRGNLMTSSFPVKCVEKCLVDSRLCPDISHCTQVKADALMLFFSAEEILVFVISYLRWMGGR